jgi:hypothetical protein
MSDFEERRTRQNHSEHTLVDTGKKDFQRQPGKTLHKCTCGWLGWLVPLEV